MKRFILVSFAVLGWAFYEMSGGADFDASAVREARLAALEAEKPVVAEAKVEAPAAPAVVAAAPSVSVDRTLPTTASAEVTRVSLNLTTLQPTEAQPAAIQASLREDDLTVPQNVGTVTSSASTPAIIPSLIDPNDGVVAETQAPQTFDDLRTVSGNRVNVRGGPGTDFGIVGRLVRGDEIRVIEDNGAGWVRFETSDGGTSGWMADFLLSGG